MKYLLVILVVLVLFKFSETRDVHKRDPIYINMNMRDACKKADDAYDNAVKKIAEKDKSSCEKKLSDERRKYNELVLKYTDANPDAINHLYYDRSDDPIMGDDKLTYKMMHMSQKNKQALTNRALWSKNSFIPYLEEELQSHAESIWWDDETLENEF